jgi:hypothetical protein
MTFEYEGRSRHTGMVDLEDDLPRLLIIEAAGWDLTRVTHGMLEDTARTLAAIRAKRARRLRAFAFDPASHPLAGPNHLRRRPQPIRWRGQSTHRPAQNARGGEGEAPLRQGG